VLIGFENRIGDKNSPFQVSNLGGMKIFFTEKYVSIAVT
jgi:hypothetical protein